LKSARSTNREAACITGVQPTYDEKHIDSCPLSYLFLTLLPASAKCLVKLDQALVLVASGLGESELGVEQRSLPIKDFEVGGDASPIPYEGCVNRILQIPDRCLLRETDLMKFLITDQSIGDVAERQLDGLLLSLIHI